MKFKTKEERDKFIIDHIYVVKSTIKQNEFLRTHNTEDLYQTGLEALIKAVDNFEEREVNGAKFSSYAYQMVRGGMYHYLLNYRNKNYVYLRDRKNREWVKVGSLEEEKCIDAPNERIWDEDKTINIEQSYEDKEFGREFLERLFRPRRGLHRLPREVLRFYFIKNYSQIEIAEKLNISRQLVHNIIDYHKNKVLDSMKDNWGIK